MQCNQSTSAFSKICVSRFPERLNSKVEIYPNFCPSSIVLGYIEKCYGIFHCEGDEAVLEDITEFLQGKGIEISA